MTESISSSKAEMRELVEAARLAFEDFVRTLEPEAIDDTREVLRRLYEATL